jgi:hypothetical protein
VAVRFLDEGGIFMIFLNAPIQQDKIIALLDGYDQDGVTFKFIEKKAPMKLLFETNQEDLEAAAKTAKNLVKAEPWGGVLFFQAGVEK